MASHCNAEDVGSHGCTQASPRPDAPFQTETLLSGSGLGDHAEATQPGTFLPEVLSFDDERITDARRFIDNAVDPYPLDDLPQNCGKPQGQTYWIRRKLYEGRLAAARYSLESRPGLADAGGGAERLAAPNLARVRHDHRDALIATLPEHISYLEMLKTLVDSRFAQPTWYAGTPATTKRPICANSATMQAPALHFQYQLRWGERIEYLLARATLSDAQPARHALARGTRRRDQSGESHTTRTTGTADPGTTAGGTPTRHGRPYSRRNAPVNATVLTPRTIRSLSSATARPRILRLADLRQSSHGSEGIRPADALSADTLGVTEMSDPRQAVRQSLKILLAGPLNCTRAWSRRPEPAGRRGGALPRRRRPTWRRGSSGPPPGSPRRPKPWPSAGDRPPPGARPRNRWRYRITTATTSPAPWSRSWNAIPAPPSR